MTMTAAMPDIGLTPIEIIDRPVDQVPYEQRRLDSVQIKGDGSRICFCGATIKDGRGWASHRRGHLNAAGRGEAYVHKQRDRTPRKAAAKKPPPKPAPQPEPVEEATVEEACTALVALFTGSTTLDMEHVELVAGWIDHTRSVIAALTPASQP